MVVRSHRDDYTEKGKHMTITETPAALTVGDAGTCART